MKILHCADLHLGVESYGRLDPATGLSSRLADFLGALDEAVEYALCEEVDLFLFCGDAYKTRDPSPTHQREFARRVRRLASNGVTVFLLVGNHDLPNAINRATSLDIFDALAVQNVHIGPRFGVHRLPTRHGVVQVVALPWIIRSHFLTHEESKEHSAEEINQIIAERAASFVADEAAKLVAHEPAILAGHLSVSGATMGAERSILLGQDYFFLRSNLANPAFDYVALGHIHRHQEIVGSPPPVVYPGSLQRVDFSEEKEAAKGFVVVEIDTSRKEPAVGPVRPRFPVTWRFEPVKARRFLTIEVDANTDDPTATVLEKLQRYDVADAIVRVLITIAQAREPLLDDTAIRRALRDAHYVAAISRKVTRETRDRLPGVIELAPIDALARFFQARNTPAERQEQLLRYATQLMQEGTE